METTMNEKLSVRTVRKNCIECSGGSPKSVLWCPCDGLHSTRCEFWPFRLGIKPATVRTRYGDRLMSPEKMPPSNVEVDSLPDGFMKASTSEIDVVGYRQPALQVERQRIRNMSDSQRRAAGERLRRAWEKAA